MIQSHASNYSKGRPGDIQFIVIHYTANNGDTAANNCNYFASANRHASAHYFVDDKGYEQSVADKDTAWHCGATSYKHKSCRNANSIGIEMCSRRNSAGKYYFNESVVKNTANLTASLMKRYGISIGNVIRHFDVTGKICPAPFVEDESKWNDFITLAKSEYERITKSVKLQRYGVILSNVEHIGYIPPNVWNGETVTHAAKRKTWNGRVPDVIFNAELFDMKTYAARSGCVHDGKTDLLSQVVGMAIKNGTTPVLSYANNAKSPLWFGGYPLLVRDGNAVVTSIPSGLEGSVARTAVAWNRTQIAMFAVKSEDGADLIDFANAIANAGFTYAINLDGGGSTSFATPLASYEQGRKTRGKIGIWIKNGTGNRIK